MSIDHTWRPSLAVALVSLGLSFGALAQGTGGGTSGGSVPIDTHRGAVHSAPSDPSVEPGRAGPASGLSPQERLFVEKAASAGFAEVAMGKLAQEKASNEQVEEFAEIMVRDHGEANEELEQLADNKGMKLPGQPEAQHRQSMQHLEKLSGAEFDRAYIRQMMNNHEIAIADYEQQSRQGQDIALKSFATKNLLILREHLRMAQTIERNLRGD